MKQVKTLTKLAPFFVALAAALLLAGCPMEATTRDVDMGGTGKLFNDNNPVEFDVELTIFNIPSTVTSVSAAGWSGNSSVAEGKVTLTSNWLGAEKQSLTLSGGKSADGIILVRGKNFVDYAMFQ